MAYLRIKGTGKSRRRYVYIMESRRSGDKVNSRILQYLGPADEVVMSELQRALTYWRVKPKGAKRRSAKVGRRKRR